LHIYGDMEKYKIYNLIGSLQELPYIQQDLIISKAIEGINAFCQPITARGEIVFPDNNIYHNSVGDMKNQEILKQYEKKFANLGVSSAQFVLDEAERHIITIGGLKTLRGFSGIISVMIEALNPSRYIISQVIELFTSNIVLALTMRSMERQVDIDKLLALVFPDLKHLGIEGITAYRNGNPKQAFWIDNKGNSQFIPSEQLIAIINKKYNKISTQKIKEINAVLPTEREFDNFAWNEFSAGGGIITALFAGKFKKPELIFSKFRSSISDIDNPTGYDEIARAFRLLKNDHKLIVKGEKIAAILETAVAINHEINNPLTAILGNTQLLLLQEDKLPDDIKSKISVIEKSALRIRDITQKLLSVVEPITTSYTDNLNMLDIDKSSSQDQDD